MIAHHGIGTEIDGEDFGQQFESFDDPGFAMVECATGQWIVAAQERAADTPTAAMVIGRISNGYERSAWTCHP